MISSIAAKLRLLIASVLWIAINVVGAQAIVRAEWSVGVGRVSITPTEPMWLAGYADRDGPAIGTRHDLWAKALIIESAEGKRAVLITLDLIGIGRSCSDDICREVGEKLGIERSAISIATSHTHTGPVVRGVLDPMFDLPSEQEAIASKYIDCLRHRAIDAVEMAAQSMAPATLSFGRGEASFAVNRRNNVESNVTSLRDRQQLVGPVDHDVPVLSVRAPEGGLRAVVFGYACHATVLNDRMWSGDWPGFASKELERRHPSAIAMFCAGCGGDQNPLPRRTVELAEDYGREIADSVDTVLAGKEQPISPTLETAYRETPLSFREVPTTHELQVQAASDDVTGRRAKLLLQNQGGESDLPTSYPYPVQAWALGEELLWFFIGGEAVIDYSLSIKLHFKEQRTWVTAYANDIMAYIPSRRVLAEGGYEAESSMLYYGQPSAWSAEVERQVLDAIENVGNAVAAHPKESLSPGTTTGNEK